jgi:hypothetical protein
MATVSFDFDCDMGYGFLPDPNEHKRVGYVTAFAGLGMAEALRADLNVTSPLTRVATPVVGVIAKFDWAGGIGDPLKIDMYLSQENAVQLKALQQKVLTTTKVTALDYIIINYDQETKQWFTQAAPQDPPLPGIVPGGQDPESGVCPHIRQQLHQPIGQSLGRGDREPDLPAAAIDGAS